MEKFISDSDFPFLVSFPRTGSHWLRMLMELYFEKPGLVRVFYYHKAKNFTCYHTHDLNLEIERKNILYLYRNPADTVFSQLMYHQQRINNEILIKYWSNIYGLHLEKWLLKENFTEKKTIIKYEKLKSDITDEFKKICAHFGLALNEEKLKSIINLATKENLKIKTPHDRQAVILCGEYGKQREIFSRKYSDLILACIFNQNKKLAEFI